MIVFDESQRDRNEPVRAPTSRANLAVVLLVPQASMPGRAPHFFLVAFPPRSCTARSSASCHRPMQPQFCSAVSKTCAHCNDFYASKGCRPFPRPTTSCACACACLLPVMNGLAFSCSPRPPQTRTLVLQAARRIPTGTFIPEYDQRDIALNAKREYKP